MEVMVRKQRAVVAADALGLAGEEVHASLGRLGERVVLPQQVAVEVAVIGDERTLEAGDGLCHKTEGNLLAGEGLGEQPYVIAVTANAPHGLVWVEIHLTMILQWL